MKIPEPLETDLQKLRSQLYKMRTATTEAKNLALKNLSLALIKNTSAILAANQADLGRLPANGNLAFRDRLTLNMDRLKLMAESLKQVAALPDPVNELVDERTLTNGLYIKRVRSPIGLILMIFESRPNVILEAFSLAFKSGNSIVLRGGSESSNTSQAIYQMLSQSLSDSGFDFACFLGIQDYNRELVEQLLLRKDIFDVVVPRGGSKLIELVENTALMPIIKNDRGLCHAYVSEDADLEMALNIVVNAKVQRPGVCNSLETVLVHQKIAEQFIPRLYTATENVKLRWKVDAFSAKYLKGLDRVELAESFDWDTEYLDLILNCKIVADLDHALEHIEKHGSKHSETIITSSEANARRFQSEVDAAAVYWNASTRFTDGFEFGLGGELGISTQKLHVRGPVGLRELTTPRWIIDGTGQVR